MSRDFALIALPTASEYECHPSSYGMANDGLTIASGRKAQREL